MALAGASIAIIAAAVIAAGSAAYAGVSQSEAADANAKNAKRQAQYEQMRSQAAAERQKTTDALRLSHQRAQLAASGRDPGDASPLQILGESAAYADADYRSILQGGEVVSDNLRFRSSMYRQEGQNALIGGGLGAASAIAGGASGVGQVRDQRALQDSYTANSGRQPPRTASGNWDWGW